MSRSKKRRKNYYSPNKRRLSIKNREQRYKKISKHYNVLSTPFNLNVDNIQKNLYNELQQINRSRLTYRQRSYKTLKNLRKNIENMQKVSETIQNPFSLITSRLPHVQLNPVLRLKECMKRKTKRKILFKLGFLGEGKGAGGRKPKHYTDLSNIKC